MKILIDISRSDYENFILQVAMCGKDLCESPSGLAKYVIAEGIPVEDIKTNAIEIPDNATNGDMIKTIIPNAEIQESMTTISLKIPESLRTCDFDKRWWNAPYERGE